MTSGRALSGAEAAFADSRLRLIRAAAKPFGSFWTKSACRIPDTFQGFANKRTRPFDKPHRRVLEICALAPTIILLLSRPAEAHVKWFAPYDLNEPPVPIGDVLTAQFVYFFLASVVVVYVFFCGDRYLLHRKFWQDIIRNELGEGRAFAIMRGGAFVFFAAVSSYGFAGQAFLLTPELKTPDRWVPWVQLLMALCALHRTTVPVIGIGIVGLYVVAINHFGIFHLLDYAILLGVAYYFFTAWTPGPTWLASRYFILYSATALTLLWASIEKWGYASWTYPLLASKPELLMGMDRSTYMVLAGYVEFVLSFLLLGSASVLSRVVALGLCATFVLAIWEFGLVDAVGHLLIIAILLLMVVYGFKGRMLVLDDKSILAEAHFMTALYVFTLVLVFVAYYGLYALTCPPCL
jgi:hypothetical protein